MEYPSDLDRVGKVHLIQHRGEIYVDLVGYEILNNIIGIMNLFTNNIMQIFYSITWLSIALNCDYTVEEQTDSSFASQLGER